MNKTGLIIISASLIVSTFGATACTALPNPAATLPPAATATIIPAMPTPTLAPMPTPAAPMPDRRKIEGALKIVGLSGGVVRANDNGTLSLRLGGQWEQIQTTASTIVVIPGKSDAKVADIRAGDRVVADLGTSDSAAAFLMAFPADYDANNILVAAVRASRSGNINVLSRQGNRALTTSATTIVVDLSGDQPTLTALGDLKPGNAIVAVGQSDGDKFDAQVIVVLDKDARALIGKIRQNQPQPTPTPKPGT